MTRTTGNRRPLIRRAALASAAALISIPVLAQVAFAHIVVTSPDAVQGGETALVTFRVPNESPTAGTTAVRINLPVDTPVAEVMVQPIPGWTITTTERKLDAPTKVGDFTIDKAPESVTWSAEAGTQIAPGQFQNFEIVMNPVPNAPTITFTATQTYSDGSVVTWDQPEPADGSEAEFPSPLLTVGSADESASADASTAPESPAASESSSASESAAASATPEATKASAVPESTPAGASSSPAITVSATPIAAPSTDSSPSSSGAAIWIAVGALAVAIVSLVITTLRRRTP